MEAIIDNLPCKKGTIDKLRAILSIFEVERQYTKVFSKLNDDYFVGQGLWFLSSQDKHGYLKENNLSKIIEELELDVSESSLDSIIGSIKEVDINDFVNQHPEVSFSIIEMIYYDSDKFKEVIKYANAERYMYDKTSIPYVIDLIIENLLALVTHSLLLPSDAQLLVNRLISVEHLTYNQRLVLAKKIIGLYKMLHSLRGNRICIFDCETTGTTRPLPIQFSFLMLDVNSNILGCNSYYIQQDSIETGATNIHGMTKLSLHNQFDAEAPEIIYEQVKKLLADKRLILVAHNISFDIRTLRNFAEQCSDDIVMPSHTFCTYYNHRDYLLGDLADYTQKSIKEYFGISDEDVISTMQEIFKNSDFQAKSHDAVFDTVTLYLILKRSQFLSG